MSKAASALLQNAPNMMFPAKAWMRPMKADVRSFFFLNPCPSIDTNHTETQYKN